MQSGVLSSYVLILIFKQQEPSPFCIYRSLSKIYWLSLGWAWASPTLAGLHCKSVFVKYVLVCLQSYTVNFKWVNLFLRRSKLAVARVQSQRPAAETTEVEACIRVLLVCSATDHGRLLTEDVRNGWILPIKMAEITLIDLGYCKLESFVAFSMTGPSLESWFENWGSTSVKVERASLWDTKNQLAWPQPFWLVNFNRVWPPLGCSQAVNMDSHNSDWMGRFR